MKTKFSDPNINHLKDYNNIFYFQIIEHKKESSLILKFESCDKLEENIRFNSIFWIEESIKKEFKEVALNNNFDFNNPKTGEFIYFYKGIHFKEINDIATPGVINYLEKERKEYFTNLKIEIVELLKEIFQMLKVKICNNLSKDFKTLFKYSINKSFQEESIISKIKKEDSLNLNL